MVERAGTRDRIAVIAVREPVVESRALPSRVDRVVWAACPLTQPHNTITLILSNKMSKIKNSSLYWTTSKDL